MSGQKTIIFILFLILFIPVCYFKAEASPEVGKVIQLTGDVDITDVNSDIRIVPEIGTSIKENHKIRTGLKAYIEILFNDNTKIFMRELSVIEVTSFRMKAENPPTKINFNTGKIRIKINKQFSGWNLIVKTNVAVIGVKNAETDLAVITTNYETKLAVLEGQANIASSNRDVIKSYELRKKEESDIELNMSPSEPVVLPQEILDSWLDYYDVVDKKRIVIKSKQENGIIDYILRKRKF